MLENTEVLCHSSITEKNSYSRAKQYMIKEIKME